MKRYFTSALGQRTRRPIRDLVLLPELFRFALQCIVIGLIIRHQIGFAPTKAHKGLLAMHSILTSPWIQR